ncbi:MAG: hypothetical protein JST16_14130 [Bdellovibrionales bacterium]|nr:hypothetical protein [Bdellovibrionales bacterium]
MSKRLVRVSLVVLATVGMAAGVSAKTKAKDKGAQRIPASSPDRMPEPTLTPDEAVGRQIWYKATAGNSRFHTYTFPQRMIGRAIDWWKFFRTSEREARFDNFGLINEPGCCRPGSAGCPAQSAEETYGFDWCPGDDVLLKYVGKPGYRDPACDLKDVNVPAGAQSPCDLEFGTSLGAVGFRKFPNPRFDAKKWRELNKKEGGVLGTWMGYVRHLGDGSVEPPFRIGTSCASCHATLNPLNLPNDNNQPEWPNISLTIGNQYLRMGSMLGSGAYTHAVEFQLYKHERPGAVDTSAVPEDQVQNPGTMNAIFNLPKRPRFNETVNRWRRIPGCVAAAGEDPNKCWKKSAETESVFHILKGGEDTVGAAGAVQRVYINIGSCSEQCWFNHLTDLRAVDPNQRNFGQTPFDVAQCRRDCPNFRAIEDRVGSIFQFLSTARPTDLHVAKGEAYEDLVDELNDKYGANSVERGRQVFAQTCVRCHSSVPGPADNRDFRRVDPQTGLREDWMGNDQLTPALEVGTYTCRALHSNHMRGHVWEQFASEDYFQRATDPNLARYASGGRGYYRNISLLSAWAYAPFMHNNSVGPEVCASVRKPEYSVYHSSYVDASGKLLANPPACVKFDPSVEGRLRLFEASMQDLLNPKARTPKISKTDKDVFYQLLPNMVVHPGKAPVGIYLKIPAGTDVSSLGGFRHKEFIGDFLEYMRAPEKFLPKAQSKFGSDAPRLVAAFESTRTKFMANPATGNRLVTADPEQLKFYFQIYGNCPASLDNQGHRFGEDLPDSDKKALIAFLMTL